MLYAGFVKLMSQAKPATCIRVAVETRDKLAKRGNKDQTFDQIVNSLLEKSATGESYDK